MKGTSMIPLQMNHWESRGRQQRIPIVVFSLLVVVSACLCVLGGVGLELLLNDHQMEYCSFLVEEFPEEGEEMCAGEKSACDRQAREREMAQTRRDIMNWSNVLRLSIRSNRSLDTELTSADQQALRECMQDPDFMRMYQDPKCTALSVRLTHNQPIDSISHVLAVITQAELLNGVNEEKKSQNGGIRLHLNDGSLGYFKMCRSTLDSESHENYTYELLAFLVDRLLAFYRTPTVSARTLALAELRSLAQAYDLAHPAPVSALSKINTIAAHCGFGEAVPGVVVAWSPFELHLFQAFIDLLTQIDTSTYGHKVLQSYAELTNETPPAKLSRPLESVTNVIFLSILGNMGKYGHNTFAAVKRNGTSTYYNNTAWSEGDYGTLVYIDNDRSFLKRPTPGTFPGLLCKQYNSPILDLCRFPRRLANRVLALSQNTSITGSDPSNSCSSLTPKHARGSCLSFSDFTLGNIIRSIDRQYGDDGYTFHGPLLSCHEAYVLDLNIQWWGNVIRKCIAKHGHEAVLLEEPWEKTYDVMALLTNELL